MRRAVPFLVGLLGLAVASSLHGERAAPHTLHVTPAGDDHNPGTREKPFATLERARDAVRRLKGEPRRPITVLVHAGRYPLAAPLVLGPEDSGTADAPVTWAAAPGAQPVLSGGRRVTGWKEVRVAGKPLWAADLPEVRAGRWYFHELWVNGQRRPRARHPNDGFLTIAGLPDAKKDTPWNKGQNRFRFRPGDLRAWDNLQDVDVVVLHLWVAARLAVAAVDDKEHVVTFVRPSRRRLTEGPDPARYYVENAFELLDSPGEWYLQRQTGTLYYWPLPGEEPARVEAIAPVLTHLLRLQGKPEGKKPIAHVTLRGLTFAHSEWWPARTEPLDVQAAMPVPGAVQAVGAEHCVLEGCTVAHTGNYALDLGPGCRHNRIAGCDLFDLGGGGIKVGEGTIRTDAARQTHDNVITDNHVHAAGRTFYQAVGVWVGQSYANQVTHNHIHDLYYTGISCGWTWGYGRTLARDNLIAFNHVHDLGQGRLSDMGGIYTLGIQPGTVIRHNVFHDVAGHRYGGWGIYLDEGSSHIVAENNVVYRTTHGGFHQHYGKENVIRNNVFALGRDAQIRRSRIEPHRSFTFERNIVYWKEGKLLDGDWREMRVAFDHNDYWRVGDGPIRFAGRTWEQWRSLGMDVHSRIADPLLRDPLKGDFRLRPGSSALDLGYVPPDLTSVGPRPQRRPARSP